VKINVELLNNFFRKGKIAELKKKLKEKNVHIDDLEYDLEKLKEEMKYRDFINTRSYNSSLDGLLRENKGLIEKVGKLEEKIKRLEDNATAETLEALLRKILPER